MAIVHGLRKSSQSVKLKNWITQCVHCSKELISPKFNRSIYAALMCSWVNNAQSPNRNKDENKMKKTNSIEHGSVLRHDVNSVSVGSWQGALKQIRFINVMPIVIITMSIRHWRPKICDIKALPAPILVRLNIYFEPNTNICSNSTNIDKGRKRWHIYCCRQHYFKQ